MFGNPGQRVNTKWKKAEEKVKVKIRRRKAIRGQGKVPEYRIGNCSGML